MSREAPQTDSMKQFQQSAQANEKMSFSSDQNSCFPLINSKASMFLAKRFPCLAPSKCFMVVKDPHWLANTDSRFYSASSVRVGVCLCCCSPRPKFKFSPLRVYVNCTDTHLTLMLLLTSCVSPKLEMNELSQIGLNLHFCRYYN